MTLREAGERRAAAERERSAASLALAEAVREAAALGIPKARIAREAGVSRVTVYDILKGNR